MQRTLLKQLVLSFRIGNDATLQFPGFLPWESLHPVVVHFPIALLLLSPLFTLLSALLPAAKGRPYPIAALIILLLGTASLPIAAATGAATARGRKDIGDGALVLAIHRQSAAEAAIVFIALSIVLLGIVLVPTDLEVERSRVITTIFPISILVLYCVGIVLILSTADAGFRIVHEFGVRSHVSEGGGRFQELLSAREFLGMRRWKQVVTGSQSRVPAAYH